MFARGSVLSRFGRGGSSPGRCPRGFPAAAAASQAASLARCASRRAWSSAASRSRARPSRSRRPARRASVRGVGRGRLGEQFLDLRQRPVRLLRRISGQLGAVQADRAQRHHALGGQQPQHLAEQPAQRLIVPRPEPGDRGVIRVQPASDHPVAHIAHAPALDHPAGPLTLAVAIQQQRDHHPRVERRPAVPVGPVAAAEPVQINSGHRVQHHEHQIVLGQPLTHIYRQQQRLITLRIHKVLRHTP